MVRAWVGIWGGGRVVVRFLPGGCRQSMMPVNEKNSLIHLYRSGVCYRKTRLPDLSLLSIFNFQLPVADFFASNF
jgi:hypothetical protein